MSRAKPAIGIFVLSSLIVLPAAADDPVKPVDLIKQDLAAVQGAWERPLTDANGNVVGRATKVIKGDVETVSYFNAADQLLHAHTVKVELQRVGPVRVFAYTDYKVTAGPNKGQKKKGRGGYLYKVEGDRFLEIQNALVGEEQDKLEVRTWKRVKGISV